MRLCFPWSSIELQYWASRSEMEGYLAAFDCKLIIGASAEQEREFFFATIQPEVRAAKGRRLAVGLCSEGYGIAPQVLSLPSQGLLLFGFNGEVVAIRMDTGGIAYCIPIESLFRSMVPLPGRGLVLVFHEIGVTVLCGNGDTSWPFGRDVLEDAWLADGALHMTFMDSDPAALELTSGKVLK